MCSGDSATAGPMLMAAMTSSTVHSGGMRVVLNRATGVSSPTVTGYGLTLSTSNST